MPNHVKNRITGPKEVIDALMGEEEGKPSVDFNKIIPKPDYVWDGSVSLAVESAAEIALGLIKWDSPPRNNPLADFQSGNYGGAASVIHYSNCVKQLKNGPFPKDFSDEDFEAFVSFMRCHRKCGLMHGLDWNREKWGTKWNAYETERVSDTVVTFETAWSAPHKVMVELANQTKAAFLHEWADEDTGSNVGRCHYKEGADDVDVEDLAGKREGYELAFDLRPDRKEDYVLVGDSYEYHDEEDDD